MHLGKDKGTMARAELTVHERPIVGIEDVLTWIV